MHNPVLNEEVVKVSRADNARVQDLGEVGVQHASAGLEKEGESEVVGSNAGGEHAFEEGEGFARGLGLARVGSDQGVVGEEAWVRDGVEDGVGVGERGRRRRRVVGRCGAEEEEKAREEKWGAERGRGSYDVGVDLLELFEGFALAD